MAATQPRIYVDPGVNDEIDVAHLKVMAHCGYKISKTDFINTVLKIGLSNEKALYDAYPAQRLQEVLPEDFQ